VHRQPIDRNLPAIEFYDGDGYVPQAVSSNIQISAVTGFNFKSGETHQDVSFVNDVDNPCVFKVRLFLSDGTEIYQSDFIQPGKSINGIDISTPLKDGLYTNALLVYECYTMDDMTMPFTRCELPVEIKCN